MENMLIDPSATNLLTGVLIGAFGMFAIGLLIRLVRFLVQLCFALFGRLLKLALLFFIGGLLPTHDSDAVANISVAEESGSVISAAPMRDRLDRAGTYVVDTAESMAEIVRKTI